MGWTSRNDAEPCCGDDPGAVGDAEEIARLLHVNNAPPEHEPFKRKDFYPPNSDGSFDDTCGAAHGCSITRLTGKQDQQVCNQAAALAGDKRTPKGAFIATTADLRDICVPDSDARAIFVYDDPNAQDRGHAVMRASPAISKGRFDEVRMKIHGAFNTRLAQDAVRHSR